MTKWRECKLGELCSDIAYGYTESASLEPVGPKFLRITDIVPGRISWASVPYCKISNENRERYKLQLGDIVIARTGATTGYTYTIKPTDLKHDAVFASYLIRYRIDREKAEPFYIGHLLTSRLWDGFVEGILGGSAQPGANAKQFADFEILLPPLPEQRAIAGVLSSLDDKIDLLHRQNKTLEGMAEALWRKMFVEEADPGWKKGKLGDLIELCYGKGLKGENRVIGKYPVIGSSGIVGYHNDYLVKGPGIVIGRKGTLGVVIYIEEDFFPIDTTYFIKSKTNSGRLFFEYFLLKEFAFEDMNSDSAVPGLNRQIAESMELSVPEIGNILEFNGLCEPLLLKKIKNNKQIRTLSHLRDTLLPKLMSGEMGVRL
jgi:type I restriction enzyme S subunit